MGSHNPDVVRRFIYFMFGNMVGVVRHRQLPSLASRLQQHAVQSTPCVVDCSTMDIITARQRTRAEATLGF